MNARKIVQSVSAGIVLGAEAIGALVLHESHSLVAAAPIIIATIVFTVWLIDSALNLSVRKWNWAANLLGVRPGSKVRVHGYWFSAIRDHYGTLLGGSVFSIEAGID